MQILVFCHAKLLQGIDHQFAGDIIKALSFTLCAASLSQPSKTSDAKLYDFCNQLTKPTPGESLHIIPTQCNQFVHAGMIVRLYTVMK